MFSVRQRSPYCNVMIEQVGRAIPYEKKSPNPLRLGLHEKN